MKEVTYIIVDIEVDGPNPGEHSMLNLAAVARSDDGSPRGEFVVNLETLPGSQGDEDTMRWWRSHSDIFAQIREDLQPVEASIHRFISFVEAQPGDKIIVGHPLSFDGLWIDWYLRKFANVRLFRGPFQGKELFVGAGIDLPSYAMAVLEFDYRKCRREFYPKDLFDPRVHTHHGLDDARGHSDLFFKLKEKRAKMKLAS